jgi:hypothetical protein
LRVEKEEKKKLALDLRSAVNGGPADHHHATDYKISAGSRNRILRALYMYIHLVIWARQFLGVFNGQPVLLAHYEMRTESYN